MTYFDHTLRTAAFLVVVCCAVRCFGQGVVRETVSLDTDPGVVRQIASANDYIADAQWEQAIELLMQVADAKGRTLIEAGPQRYVSVRYYCNAQFASLPPEGLAAYRRRVDPQAERWLKQAEEEQDASLLKRVFENAFASSSGDEALWKLGEHAWEEGRYAAARSYWSLLLPETAETPGVARVRLRYPDSDFAPAPVRARLVLCSIAAGRRDRARRELEQFRKDFPDADGTLAGRTGRLSELLEGLFAGSRSWTFPRVEATAATFAGNSRRNFIVPSGVDPAYLQWSTNWIPTPIVSKSTAQRARRSTFASRPVVFNNVLLVSDATRIAAFDLATGRPAWSASDDASPVIYPPFPDPVPPSTLHPLAGHPQYTMTIEGGRLYARMGVPVIRRARNEFPIESDLVCLDLARGEGKLRWKVPASSLATKETSWVFAGSPLVLDGRLYVAMIQSVPAARVHVGCFDADTGRLIWNQQLCGALVEVSEAFNLLGHHLLTAGQGMIVYATQFGAVAAVDAESGNVEWVVTYPSQSHEPDEVPARMTPCLLYGETLIAAPADSDELLAIDLHSGIVRWKRHLGERMRHLLGAREGRLFAGGDRLWSLDVATGRVLWKVGYSDPAGAGFGRGLVVGDYVYWPLREEVLIVAQDSGRIARRVQIARRHKIGGGDLAVAGGVLIVTSPERISVLGPRPVAPSAEGAN